MSLTNTRTEKSNYNYMIHLDEIIKDILTYHKNDGYDKFEDVSFYLKQKIVRLSNYYKIPNFHKKLSLDMTDKDKTIFSAIGSKTKKQLSKVENNIEDVLEKSNLLQWAGIDFGKNVWYKLKLSMDRLLIKENAEFIKFFGKIYGKEADYFILYGRLKSYPKSKYSKNPYHEPEGLEGINNYTFWVAGTILEDWYQLPEITTTQMKESFAIKYYFTGNLNSRVKAFSPFSGNEAHLLKCQILRIMHSCFIVPDGYLKTKAVENAEEIYGIDISDKVTQVDEEFKLTATNEELLSLDKWVHEFAFIYPSGKIFDAEAQDQIARLRAISQDLRKYLLKINS